MLNGSFLSLCLSHCFSANWINVGEPFQECRGESVSNDLIFNHWKPTQGLIGIDLCPELSHSLEGYDARTCHWMLNDEFGSGMRIILRDGGCISAYCLR